MRNKQIDGLRGVTILIIVIYHIFFRYQQLFMNSGMLFYHMGTFGVTIFLLISCYLLARNSTENQLSFMSNQYMGRNFNLKRFYLKKIFRLWPCYFVCITITFFVLQLFNLPGRTSDYLDYLLNIFFINGYIGFNYVDSAHWYITTLISIIIVIGIIRKLRMDDVVPIYAFWLTAGLILDLIGLTSLARVIGGPYIGIACIGIALRKTEQEKSWGLSTPWLAIYLLSVFYIIVVQDLASLICLLIVVPFFKIVINKKALILEFRPLQFVGMISYPLYLIHQNIGYVIVYYLGINFNFFYINAFIAVIVVTLLAIVLYYLVEKPFDRLLKKVGKQIDFNQTTTDNGGFGHE